MSRIFDLVDPARIKRIIAQYQQAWGCPFFLLDEDKKVLFKSPSDAPEERLSMLPVSVRDALACYVAVPDTRSGVLDFAAKNLSSIAEMGYEIESLSGEVARNYEELSLLWKVSSTLGAGLDVESICRVLLDEVMNICPSSNVAIFLVGESEYSADVTARGEYASGQLLFFPKLSVGVDADKALTMIFSTENGLMGHVFGKKEAVTVCDVSRDVRFEGFPYEVNRILIVPLVVEGSVLGAVVASDKTDGEEYYANEIKNISSIASECAISIRKALLFEEVRTMLYSISESFSLAIDAKDTYTYGHSKRVSEIATAIASEMGFAQDEISRIKLAALLHDIGKIGTPEDILHKDDVLNDYEIQRMREHPIIGSKMIEHIHRMKDISLWILYHHEKYDGSGYPSGLKGDDIPVPSRIITVADYFDALTSDRPYRPAFSKRDAIRIMRDKTGVHLDPDILHSFLRIYS